MINKFQSMASFKNSHLRWLGIIVKSLSLCCYYKNNRDTKIHRESYTFSSKVIVIEITESHWAQDKNLIKLSCVITCLLSTEYTL